MTLFLIPNLNRIINSDHIITADFSPEHTLPTHYGDQDLLIAEKLIRPALDLVLTQIDTELTGDGFGGEFRGGSSQNVSLVIHGDDAILLWEALCRESYSIGSMFIHQQEAAHVQ